MDCETETAFEGADVVFEEIGIFVEVDCLKRKFSKAFPSVGVGCAVRGHAAAAELGAGSVLVVHGEGFGSRDFGER